MREADLRSAPAEATAFLNQVMGLALSESAVEALEMRTEGWIAGLQLAALSLQRRAGATDLIESFDGSHRYVIDYLAQEVLLQQSDDVRDFLCQTSVLDRLTASLCDAVTGREDSKAVLSILHLCLGQLYYETDELARAREHISEGLSLGQHVRMHGFTRLGQMWLAEARVALIGASALALHVALGGPAPQPNLPAGAPAEMWPIVLPILFLSNVFVGGPIAEELGWRGFALPRLQARIGALAAGLVLGAAWGLWHLPFFLFGEGASVVGDTPFVWYVLLVTAWPALMTWVYNNARESVLLMVLFHAGINTTMGRLGLAGASGGSRLVVLNVALTWLVVAAVSIRFGPARLVHKEIPPLRALEH